MSSSVEMTSSLNDITKNMSSNSLTVNSSQNNTTTTTTTTTTNFSSVSTPRLTKTSTIQSSSSSSFNYNSILPLSSTNPHSTSSPYVNGLLTCLQSQQVSIDETPNKLLYKKIELFMEKMQDEQNGVPIKTVKSFMSKIPSVFTGTDLIQWIIRKIDVEDTCEALHFAHLVSSHGYVFPIDDHILTVKNDGTFFRFQVRILF